MKMGWRRNYMRQKGYFLNILREYKERADIRVYLEILLSLMTISVFAIFALRPTLLTIAELLREIERKKEVVAQMDTKIANLTSAQILYDQKRGQINLLKEALPDYPQPDIILRQFEGLSQNNGVEVTNLTFDEAPLKGNPTANRKRSRRDEKEVANSLPVTANISTETTNYPTIANLINNFENLRIPLNIDRLTLTTTDQNNQKLLILNLDGYVLFNEMK